MVTRQHEPMAMARVYKTVDGYSVAALSPEGVPWWSVAGTDKFEVRARAYHYAQMYGHDVSALSTAMQRVMFGGQQRSRIKVR